LAAGETKWAALSARGTSPQNKLREKLNHWTLWRAAEDVVPEVNRLLKGAMCGLGEKKLKY